VPPTHHNFDVAHVTVIVLTFATPFILAWIAKRRPSGRFTAATAWCIAGFLVANAIAQWVYHLATGQMNTQRAMPMQLCDWALVATVVALLTRRQRWYEPAYFWGLGGTLQAIITPNLDCGFPTFRWISFFITHSGIVAGVLFMTGAMNLRPRPISMLRVLFWSEVYLACALAVNTLTGANYGFLSRKPDGPSLLDCLSQSHALYVLEMNLLAIVFFAILYLPFAAWDAWNALRPDNPVSNRPIQ
jgi:hypothetical integral membrane protein (TIGR02206 family)